MADFDTIGGLLGKWFCAKQIKRGLRFFIGCKKEDDFKHVEELINQTHEAIDRLAEISPTQTGIAYVDKIYRRRHPVRESTIKLEEIAPAMDSTEILKRYRETKLKALQMSKTETYTIAEPVMKVTSSTQFCLEDSVLPIGAQGDIGHLHFQNVRLPKEIWRKYVYMRVKNSTEYHNAKAEGRQAEFEDAKRRPDSIVGFRYDYTQRAYGTYYSAHQLMKIGEIPPAVKSNAELQIAPDDDEFFHYGRWDRVDIVGEFLAGRFNRELATFVMRYLAKEAKRNIVVLPTCFAEGIPSELAPYRLSSNAIWLVMDQEDPYVVLANFYCRRISIFARNPDERIKMWLLDMVRWVALPEFNLHKGWNEVYMEEIPYIYPLSILITSFVLVDHVLRKRARPEVITRREIYDMEECIAIALLEEYCNA